MNIRFYISLLVRRMPVMLALIIVCSGIGVITALNLPPTYSTTATLLVEDAQIGSQARNSNVDYGSERLQVIEKRLITRANMIDIANQHTVFENLRELPPDEVVALMKQQTRLRRSSGRNQATLMTVTFQARTGRIAAAVVNEYLTIIQQDASSQRQDEVGRTLAFFEQEVARLSGDLDQQSVRIVQFKNQNANALPDDADSLRGRQSLLLDRLDRLGSDRELLARQREEIVAIYEATGQISAPSAIQRTPEEQQLARLRLELEGLRAIFSDTNPKVVSLTNQIERLEAIVLAQPVSAGVEPEIDVQGALLAASLAEIDERLSGMDSERDSAESELDQIGLSLSAISGNAIALAALERDYANIQSRYNQAVNSLDAARFESRIEQTRQGQRITVIEGAAVPQVPTGPNRTKIAATGIGAGLGLAAGFFLLLEFLNRSIRRPAEIQSRFNIVPIAVIPYIESRRERMLRRGLLLTAVLAVLVGVPAILWYIDTNILPLELIADKIIEKIGL